MFLPLAKGGNLALAFFLELGTLVAWGYWGFTTGSNLWMKGVSGLGIPLLLIIIWMCYGAPRARWYLNGPWRLLLKIFFFGSAAVALYLANQPIWAIIFAALFLINTLLGAIWKQDQENRELTLSQSK